MKEEILSRDFDLGFSGNSEDVVMRALHLLGNCVNVTSSSNRNGEFTIAPSQTVPALFELNFYSNGLFHVFISDAIIGTSRHRVRAFVPLFLSFSASLHLLLCVCSLQHPVAAARAGGGGGAGAEAQRSQQPPPQPGETHPQGRQPLPLPHQRGHRGARKSRTPSFLHH